MGWGLTAQGERAAYITPRQRQARAPYPAPKIPSTTPITPITHPQYPQTLAGVL